MTLAVSHGYKLRRRYSWGLFFATYLVTSLLLLPILAPLFGRSPLPITGNLRPLNYMTCILNRHYVRPELKKQIIQLADRMAQKYDGTKTNYLDANFPFFNRFPLLPHLSHNDGKKLDLAFYYLKNSTPTNTAPGFTGYGIYDEPGEGESNYPLICKQKGYWQYGLLSSFVLQSSKAGYQVDTQRTTDLVEMLAEDPATDKVFIEPHLKQRWQLNRFDNIRFHGCQAVRHDDHIHTQIR